jgi:transcriptional pleiotropic regulator of transition state genes
MESGSVWPEYCGKDILLMSIKSTGIVRKVDELGRIVLPIELRRTLNIAERDTMEIFVDGSSIVLKKYVPESAKAGKGKKVICDVCKKAME